MKLSRAFSFILTLVLVSVLFVSCTGEVPPPYETDKVLGSVNVNLKIVVLEKAEGATEATETVLLEKSVPVSSTSRPTLMAKDLFNCLDEDGHIPSEYSNSRFKSIENYEANDTHMWYWSLNGKDDFGDRVQIFEGDTIVLTYAEKGADIATDESGNVLTMTVPLTIVAGNDTIYSGEYVIEGQNSITVKELIKLLRDKESLFTASVAGSIKSINDYKTNDTNAWKIYIDEAEKKPSAKIKNGETVLISYEAI